MPRYVRHSCPVCSAIIDLKLFEWHCISNHAIKTGEEVWSCRGCLNPFSAEEFTEHIDRCTELQMEKARDVYGPRSSKGVMTDLDSTEYHDPSNKDDNTCFLCGLMFETKEKCTAHQHHYHMQWIAKGITREEMSAAISKVIADNETESEDCHVNKEKKRFEKIDSLDEDELNIIKFQEKIGHYCFLCNSLIINYKLYYLHMCNFHQLEKKFVCRITGCGKKFTQTVLFQKHAEVHNQESDVFCPRCNIIFNNEEDLNDHLITWKHASKYFQEEEFRISNPCNFMCKVCHLSFGMFDTFIKHMETASHEYRCGECRKIFHRTDILRRHISVEHPEIAKTCKICNAELAHPNDHVVLHEIEFQCNKCEEKFLLKEHLVAHSEVHLEDLACPEGCGKSFSRIALYKHLQRHNSDKRYKCSICDKDQFTKKRLDRHIRRHQSDTSKNQRNLEKYRSDDSDIDDPPIAPTAEK